MIGQALLKNPSIFGDTKNCFLIADEYLNIAQENQEKVSIVRRHFFYFFEELFQITNTQRKQLGEAQSYQDLKDFLSLIQQKID